MPKKALKPCYKVREAYSEAAQRPDTFTIFPVGRGFVECVGFPVELFSSMPVTAVEAFTGVPNVFLFAENPQGAKVLDLGCGARLDSLVAAQRTGSEGLVVGVDFSAPMLNHACLSADQTQAGHVTFFVSDAKRLPFRAGSDFVLRNSCSLRS